MPAIPMVRVGEPSRYEALSVWPLFAECDDAVNYLLADEALASNTVTVEEVSEGGSVPNLLVNNQAENLVLFLEGEELRGAKQNRVLNTSVLVAAKSKTLIPVSCVEQGRWRYQSRGFASGGRHSSSKLRHILKKTVTKSAQAGRGHGSDQHAVWAEVSRQMDSLGAASATAAMADTYETHQGRLAEFRDRVRHVAGASGLAVAVGGKVVSVDLFDKASTCERVWDRLLTGVIMDALESGPNEATVRLEDVESALGTLRSAPWQQTQSVGAGDEFRAELEGDRHASALQCRDALVHGSLVMA